MGFIAEFNDNWADEMDVFGLKYFESMDEYIEEFCWDTAFSRLDVTPQEMAEFLGLPKNENEGRWYSYEKEMVEYFTKHPGEMKKMFYELDGDDEDEGFLGFDIDNIYTNFIYAALNIRMKEDKHFSMYNDEGVSIGVGTNEEIYMSISDYLDYIEPTIFAEGEVAEKIIKGNTHFHRGHFYM